MFRKLLLALAFLLLPIAGAHALGLGGISLQSRLNQPLDAEIELRSVEPGDLEKLKVNLATREEFEQAGLDRPFLLASLKFETVQRGDRTIIKVSTREAFREPFVSFLLKVEWPNGRLLREYTLLLDPPVVSREGAPPVQAPSAGGAPQMGSVQPAIPSTPAPVSRVPRAAQAPRVSSVAGDEYRVRRGDSLYKIARETITDPAVSSQQAMLAFLRANREAFINDNINLLKEGYVLRIPSSQEALSVDQAEAVAEVRRQVAEWRTYRQQRASESSGGAPAVASAPQPRLEVVAPKSEAGAASGSGGEAAADGDTANLQRDLALATEAAEARRLENEELREQVTGLEEKLAEMQRLVTVKVDELAALQARLQEAQAGGDATAPAGAEEPKTAEAAPTGAETPKPEAAAPDAAAKTEMAAPAGESPKPAEPAMAESKEAAPPAPVSEPAPQTTVQAPKVEMAPEPSPVGFFDDLLANLMADPVMLGGVGGGVLLLILLLFYMAQRRKAAAAEEAAFATDMLADEGAAETSEIDDEFLEAAAAMEVADFAEPEAPAQAPEDKGGVDQVIAEADVYLAYGRYQQAEELIKGALEENPERLDLTSKLLEVYFATRDREAFESVVGEVHGELQAAGGAEWDKLQLMGQDLCPGNPLFGGSSLGTADAETTLPPGALDTGISFDPFSEAAKEEAVAEEETEDDDLSLEFDMGGLTETRAGADAGEDAEVDFDFEIDEAKEEEVEVPEIEGEPSQALEFDSTLLGVDQEDEDLDLSFDTEEAAVEKLSESGLDLDFGEEETAGKDRDLSSTDFDLELNTIQTDTTQLGLEAAAEEEETAPPVAREDASMAEDRDFSIEWDITGMGLEAPEEESEADISGARMAESIDELESTAVLDFTAVPLDDADEGEADMVATKLDLAKAYIDMGDADGAKNILDEVAKEGNETQRREAEDLLAGL